MADSKLFNPKVTPDAHNIGAMVKATKRYKTIIEDFREKDQPFPVLAWKILPSPWNRLGAPLNMMYIHHELALGIHTKGFDPTRPRAGVIVRRTNPDKIKRLKAHALSMQAVAKSLWPQLNLDSPECVYECISSNHLQTVFKMYQTGYTSPLVNITFIVPDDEQDLKDRIEIGHPCWILRDDIPDEDMIFLSEYLNSDQNENQTTSEISTLSQVNSFVEQELEKTPHPQVAKIVALVSQHSLLKLKADNIADFAHFSTNLNPSSGLLKELVSWHSRHINPKEICIVPRWLGEIAKILGKEFYLVLFGCTLIQYRADQKQEQTRPLPDISRAISAPELNGLMKDTTNIGKVQEFLYHSRMALLEPLQQRMGSEDIAKSKINMLEGFLSAFADQAIKGRVRTQCQWQV